MSAGMNSSHVVAIGQPVVLDQLILYLLYMYKASAGKDSPGHACRAVYFAECLANSGWNGSFLLIYNINQVECISVGTETLHLCLLTRVVRLYLIVWLSANSTNNILFWAISIHGEWCQWLVGMWFFRKWTMASWNPWILDCQTSDGCAATSDFVFKTQHVSFRRRNATSLTTDVHAAGAAFCFYVVDLSAHPLTDEPDLFVHAHYFLLLLLPGPTLPKHTLLDVKRSHR